MVNLNKELRDLAHHTSIYGATEIFSRFIGFLMIPFYTYYLKPADYGINELVGITIELISIVLGMGISDAVYRFYFDKDVKSPNIVISSACIGVPLLSLIVLSILSFFSKQLSNLVLGDTKYWLYITLSLASLWFGQQINLVYTYLRITESSKSYSILALSRLTIALSLNIIFVAGLKWGVLGIFVSNLITVALFSLCTFPFLLKKVGFSFSIPLAKKMLRYSMPIIPANMASLIVNASDRFFIRAFLSLADAGIYSLGYKLGNIVFYIVRVPFMQIWEPRRYALYRDNAPPQIYARIATYFFTLMVFIGLGISVLIQDVIKIISPREYWQAAAYVPAIVVCYIIYALDHHVAFGISIIKKTEYWTYVNLVMGAMNLGLNYILISQYGVWGAICATFIPLVFKISALYMIAKRFFPIPFEWRRMAGFLSIAAGMYFLSVFIHPSVLAVSFLYDLLIIIVFLLIIWISGLLYADEKHQIKVFLQKFYRKHTAEAL